MLYDAITNKEKEIAMCFYIIVGHPIIHFVNIDKDGNYIDNTLGVWSTRYDYYLIKRINNKDYFSVESIFRKYRKEIHNKLPKYIRWFSYIEF